MGSRNIIDLRKKRLGGSRIAALPLPPSRRRKREPLRLRRQKTRLVIAGCSILGIVLFGVAISFASHMPRLNVQNITVSGTAHIDPVAIEHYAREYLYDGARQILSKSNIFLYRPKVLAARIEDDFPRAKSAHVEKTSLFATTVEIQIEERQSFAKWCEESTVSVTLASSTPEMDCFVLDETGFIFDTYDPTREEVFTSDYSFAGGIQRAAGASSPIGSTFAPSHFDGMLALLTLLRENGFASLGATVVSDDDFAIALEAGFFLKASFGANAETLARNLVLVLQSEHLRDRQGELEYVDLRFGNRVYFKIKGAQSSELGVQ